MPLALVDGEAAGAALKQTPGCVLARITGARKGAIVDGLHDDATCDRLVELIEGGARLATKQGLRARHTHRLRAAGVRVPPMDARSGGFDQYRRLPRRPRRAQAVPPDRADAEPGARDRAFSHRTRLPPHAVARRSARVPACRSRAGHARRVCSRLVKHQGTSWDFAIEELRRYYQRVAARVRRAIDWEAARNARGRRRERRAAAVFRRARTMVPVRRDACSAAGPRSCTRRLPSDRDGAFAPEPFDRRRLGALANQMRAHGDAVARPAGGPPRIARRGRADAGRSGPRRPRRAARAVRLDPHGSTMPAAASGSTAITTSGRCCGPKRTSSSWISKAIPRSRLPSGGRSSRR